MKYSGMRKEAEKKTTKNQFTRAQMNPNEEDKIICPANHEFTLVDTRIERRGVYPREIEMYEVKNRTNDTKVSRARILQKRSQRKSFD